MGIRLPMLLMVAMICACSSAQTIEPYESDEHTLLLYHFDGDGDEILDSGPLGLHGSMNEGAPERVEGIIGSALRFSEGRTLTLDGADAALRGMDQLTIELWLRTSNDDVTRRQRTIMFWEHYLITIFEGNRFTGHVYGPGGESEPGAKHILRGRTSCASGQWMHVAVTYDGERARLFVNGAQEVSLKMTGPINTGRGGLQISNAGADGFLGELDELRISSIARPRFIAPRQLDICRMACDLGLSPGNFRVLFTPMVPAGVSAVTCEAKLGDGVLARMVIEADSLTPLDDASWLEGRAELVLPVPAGIAGEDTVTCAIGYTRDGEPARIKREFAVRVEAMLPAPASEVRAAWTHSHRIERPDDIFSRMAAGGVNAAIMRVRRGETAYFDSLMGPVVELPFGNANFMADAIAACERHDIDLHCYVNNFPIGSPDGVFAQRLLADGRWQKSPEGDDIAYMCPSDPRNVQLVRDAMVELAMNYDFAGVQYDFIRFPNETGCYCVRCRARFEERLGHAVADWPAAVLRGGELYEQFTNARCDLITEAVRITSSAIREINRDVVISAAVFAMDPEKARHTVGQAWAQWAHEGLVDALCPMSYVYDTRAFEDTVTTIIEAVAGTVPIYAGIGVRSGNGVMHYPEEMAAKINITRRLGVAGFAMFCVTPATDVPETILIPLRGSVLAGDGRL